MEKIYLFVIIYRPPNTLTNELIKACMDELGIYYIRFNLDLNLFCS